MTDQTFGALQTFANVIICMQPSVYILTQVHGGSVMRSRFEYEAPSLLKKVALTIKAPHRWRSRVRPWVFDKKSGVRFQLAQDEHAALKPLTLSHAERQHSS